MRSCRIRQVIHHYKYKYILEVEPEPMTKIFYPDAETGKATLGTAIMLGNGAFVQLHNLYSIQYTSFQGLIEDMG